MKNVFYEIWVGVPYALDIFVGKMKTQFEIFSVLLFLVVFIFFWLLKMLFLVFSFFVILQFASPQVARVANYKITKNENTKNKIFGSQKKIKITKNSKPKNVSKTSSRHRIEFLYCLYTYRVRLTDTRWRAHQNCFRNGV